MKLSADEDWQMAANDISPESVYIPYIVDNQ
jgi:hypothetical protein